MHNRALAIIVDEHRSLAAVVHGLRFILREMKEHGAAPQFQLLWAMLYYVESFPERLHHPKENEYLFRKLRSRTHEADSVLDELERQHAEGPAITQALQAALGRFEAGAAGGREQFIAAAEEFCTFSMQHMAQEEQFIIPLAKRSLTAEDWEEIAASFSENGDPKFGAAPGQEFEDLFARIVAMAPPPIGYGSPPPP